MSFANPFMVSQSNRNGYADIHVVPFWVLHSRSTEYPFRFRLIHTFSVLKLMKFYLKRKKKTLRRLSTVISIYSFHFKWEESYVNSNSQILNCYRSVFVCIWHGRQLLISRIEFFPFSQQVQGLSALCLFIRLLSDPTTILCEHE